MKKYSLLFSTLLFVNVCQPVGFTGRAKTQFGPFSLAYDTDLSTKLIICVATVALATKIGYDISWHDRYTTKTNDWYNLLISSIERNNISSLDHAKLISIFSAVDHDEILQMHLWVNNAYSNWLTPWNWTNCLKQSFEKLQIIEILTLYADLIAKKDTVTGFDLVKSFRCKYGSIFVYPLLSAYQIINDHVQFVRNLSCHLLKNILMSAIEPLNDFKVLLRQENEYQQEVLAKRTNDLQQEMINAIAASGCRR
ncbi:hypothetical protein KBB68_03070 [Candidatus Babeliales bacterium]|nr:hypothetical protein [Candidatus Babeliales bacterium]